MQDMIRKHFKIGLYGTNAHQDLRKSITALTPEIARIRLNNDFHSCWELIHHMVICQDGIVKGLKGEKYDWKEADKNNWPSEESMLSDANFTLLVGKFINGLKIAEELIETVDLTKMYTLWDRLSGFDAFLVLIQHNSYHIGQLVTVRKTLGKWI